MPARTASVLAALTLAATAAVTWPVVSSAPATAGGSGKTISLDVRFSTFFLLDFGANGVKQVTSFQDPFDPSRGDQVIFRDQLLRAGNLAGHDDGSCTVSDFVPADADPIKLNCQVTFELPDGQIATQGAATNNPVKNLAVTGGTGRYIGAAGVAVLTEFPDDTGTVVIRLSR